MRLEKELDRKPIVTIGIPVYNGEKFIRKKLDTVLSQSFSNFQVLISDNASTDKTQVICKEYVNKDERVVYFQQNNNIGSRNNFKFLLNKVNTEYFLWSAIDDVMESTFLEKTLNILQFKKNNVGCISKIKYYAINNEENISFVQLITLNGNFNKKARMLLKKNIANVLYSVYRTGILKKCLVNDPIGTWDNATVLNILKYGDIEVIDEVLLSFFDGGISSTGIIDRLKTEPDYQKINFPKSFFFYWCIENLGKKFFLKNIDIFIWLNLKTFLDYIKEVIKKSF